MKDNMSKPFRDLASFGKRMEYKIIAEMLLEDLDIYMPLVDDDAIDAVVKKPDGNFDYKYDKQHNRWVTDLFELWRVQRIIPGQDVVAGLVSPFQLGADVVVAGLFEVVGCCLGNAQIGWPVLVIQQGVGIF